MYPLNMNNARLGGYAVANDIDEHRRLTEAGYEPALVEEKPRRGRPPKVADDQPADAPADAPDDITEPPSE